MAEELDIPIQRDVRDGVPVYWVPEAEHCTGALMFRVGWTDEPIAARGITHLIEHLALFGLGPKVPYKFNGFVAGIHTVFWATGTPAEVASFMRHVSAAISELPFDRLEAESRVLLAEESTRQLHVVDRIQWCRYGARGPGLAVIPEYALRAPDAAAVRAWAAERFTAENATAWFSGALPDDLRFEGLPRGRRFPCEEPALIPRLRLPAFLYDKTDGVAVSFVTDRESWIGVPWTVAATRLHERLRFREGLTHAVQSELHHISTHRSHSTIWARCLAADAPALQDSLLEVLEDLARKGPTPAELAEGREEWTKHRDKWETIAQHIDNWALNELLGYRVASLSELRAEFDARTPEMWAASAQQALDSALLQLPPGCTPAREHFNAFPYWSDAITRGRRYRSAAQRFPWSKKGPELIIGADGVSLVTPEGYAVTVLYDACAGAILYPDGSIRLYGEDGFEVGVAPREWRNGEDASREVLRALPPDRLLRIQHR